MRRRILFASHGPADSVTAVFRTVSMRAEYLRRRGDEVDVIFPRDLATGRWPRLQPILLPIALARRDLRSYDVVVFHSYLGWAHELSRGPSNPARRPATIVAFHGLEPLYLRAVEAELRQTGEQLSARFRLLHKVLLPSLLRSACRRADRVLCLNSLEEAFLVQQHWVEPARVAIVPNGVAPELLAAERSHAPAGRRLLFTGQWLRAKGTRYLTAAFARIAERFSDAELTCMGTGAGPERVLGDFDEAHRGRVRVLPRVDSHQLAQELARADLFLFPSLSEGFSSALIEAMASALPVIATPVGAAVDLLRHGDNAVVVPVANTDALVQAAVQLIADPARRSALGAAARQTAQNFTWEQANGRFAAEIDRVSKHLRQ